MATPLAIPPGLSSLAAAPTVTTAFGVVAAGRPLQLAFKQISERQYLTELSAPGNIAELSVFTLPGVTIPADRGVIIYYSTHLSDWTALATLLTEKPSTIVRTGWPSNENTKAAGSVALLLSIEPLDTVSTIISGLSALEWDKLAFAQLIAKDLVNFLQSFAQVLPVGERIVLTPDAVDKWLKKFEERFKHDPNFLLKKHSA